MLKSLLKYVLIASLSSLTLFGQDTTDVSWGDGTPGTLEAAITGPGVYRLEAGKVYLTLEHIPVGDTLSSGGAIHIVGATPAEGQHPATIQPYINAAGEIGHTNGELFTVVGDDAELALKGLILNGTSFGGEGALHGCASARGARNKIVVDDCVVYGIAHLAFFTMGTQTDFHFTNSVATAFTNGPGGMFYGGLFWGGGSWMGTVDTFQVQYSTVSDVVGEAIVLYEHVDHGLIDHVTFNNIVMNAIWYRGQNNLTVTNNLFADTKSYGQSTYDASSWGVWYPGGVGQMAVRPYDYSGLVDTTTGLSDSTYTMGDGQVVDMGSRNIHYSNNAWHTTTQFSDWITSLAATPWGWEVSSTTYGDSVFVDDTTFVGFTDTTVTTSMQMDTMLSVADQRKWVDDTTAVTIAQGTGVMQADNVESPNLGLMLDGRYLRNQLARTLDFRDDQTTQGVGSTRWWGYENDGSHTNLQWPMFRDYRYSSGSVAATASTTGGPVGDPRWTPHNMLKTDASIPNTFALEQNYPNPFNPTTEIQFSLTQASKVNLTIFNVLGQKVRVLANEAKLPGTHTVRWNGLDDMGSAVSTGLYFYTLTDGNRSVTKKMALMK
tara:strand:+ start:1174 stop:2985 length:1812 start_codon:yes stop_codon:yes gene_type:complete